MKARRRYRYGMAEQAAPAPPWAPRAEQPAGALSLQQSCCAWLARNLQEIDALEDLPDHLAHMVRGFIQQDRRLLNDNGLVVWLEAVFAERAAEHLSLRWASSIGDAVLRVLAAEEQWSSSLLALDLGFCEQIGYAGMVALCPQGCRRCGDGTAEAIGRHCRQLTALNMEVLNKLTDVGMQHVVCGCRELEELLLGGCTMLSNISTQLSADHCKGLHRLGLGGNPNICDVDMEDVGRLLQLEWLELRACGKVSDAGIKQIGMLASRQAKAVERWQGGGATGEPPPALTHLDLGGLGRMSDTALLKLLTRTHSLTSLDLRGASRLTEDGLSRALASVTLEGIQSAPALNAFCMRKLALKGCAAGSERVIEAIQAARPELAIA